MLLHAVTSEAHKKWGGLVSKVVISGATQSRLFHRPKATVNEKLVSAPKMFAQRTRAGGISLSLCHYLMTSS